jgi:hypothetical protein
MTPQTLPHDGAERAEPTEDPDAEVTERAELAELFPAPAERDLPAARSAALLTGLMREVGDAVAAGEVAASEPTPLWRRPLVWRIGVPVGMLAIVGGTIAAMMVDTSPAPAAYPLNIACASGYSDDPQSPVMEIALVSEARTPEEICSRFWSEMASTPDPQNGPQVSMPAPEKTDPADLVACTKSDSSTLVTVFPKPAGTTPQEACVGLGLVRPDDGPVYSGASALQLRTLRQRLYERLRGPAGCTPSPEVKTVVEGRLTELGMTGWSVDDRRVPVPVQERILFSVDVPAGKVVLTNTDNSGSDGGVGCYVPGTAAS